MLSLASVYRRAGLVLRGELPDDLPAVLEFLALTGRRDLRLQVIRSVFPGLRRLLDCVGGLDPYHRVLRSVVKLFELELGGGGG